MINQPKLRATKLYRCIAKNDVDSIKNLIETGFNINMTNSSGDTPLHIAVKNQSVDVVKFLLEQPGIFVDKINHHGITPFLLCLQNCDDTDEIASLLLNAGSRTTIADFETGTYPLHYAVQRKTSLIALQLIERGANVNTRTRYVGNTPLHLACIGGNTDVVHELILNGADVDAKNSSGLTSLHMAVVNNQYDNMCVLLYYNASANEKSKLSKATPFLHACQFSRNWDILRYLINYVADINDTNIVSETNLDLLISYNAPSDIIVDIVNRNADVNAIRHVNFESVVTERDSSIFKAIWPRYDSRLLVSRKYEVLKKFIDTCPFPMEEFLDCFYMIFDSPYIEDILHQYTSKIDSEVDNLYTVLATKNIPLEERLKIYAILLRYSIPVYYDDICSLYEKYGFDECVELILTGGCQIEPTRLDRVHFMVNCICYNKAPSYSREYLLSHREYLFRYRKLRAKFYTSGENEITIYSCVPSLLELCRDSARDILYKYNTKSYAFNVYSAIVSMNMATKFKNILFLKDPIYPAHTTELS